MDTTNANELEHIISFRACPRIINEDDFSDYFDWVDVEDATSTDAHGLIIQKTLPQTTLLSQTSDNTEPFLNTPDISSNDFINWPSNDESSSSSGTIGSILDVYTTHHADEIPQSTESDDEEEDLVKRLHLHFIKDRTDEAVSISWEFSYSATKTPSFVAEKIEDLFTAWIDVIASKSQLVIKLRGYERKTIRTSESKAVWRTFVYPAGTARENQRFAALLRMLELISEAINKDLIYTKRDIYYKDVLLFGSQQFVNSLVDDIAIALGVPRRTLHITAAAKGLVCGDLDIHKIDGTIISCRAEGEGVLIPAISDIQKLDIGRCQSVLIIEKEAIFRTLAESGEWKSLPGLPILVCGKGYPDIATREFAHSLYITKNLDDEYLRFYCLVDYDPHGLDIYTMYKNGSLLSGLRDNNDMALPTLKHLGIKFSDIHEYFSEKQVAPFGNVGAAEAHDGERRSKKQRRVADPLLPHLLHTGLLPMTKHDRAKATGMLLRDETEYSEDLRNLLFVGYKAEIQILADQLGRYLEEKLAGSA